MLEELKTFIAVVEYKNFTKAGLHLNLSQPSVSTHIKNLENHFGVILIDRSIKQKTIFITESGYILYKRAKEIVHLLDVAYQEVRHVSDSIKGHLKVGASLTIGEYILPKFLSIFSEKYPDIEVELFIENTSTVCSKLSNLILDMGLIEGTISSFNFEQNYFLKDKMVLATPYNSNLLNGDFSVAKLQNQTWIAREAGSGTRESLNLFLNANEIIPKHIMVLGSNYAVKEAVRNNLGITVISSLITSPSVENNELSTIELDDIYNRHFSCITPKNITLSKVCQVFIEELKEYTLTL
ncbi:LysR family transcriptional regulator [Romboutsia weinsteinii]|uniref:LysR family transcriptional regulator n=1 Tax=Romboutsia weinsteinii TaxID=2020949 RepID=A0A371J043_9FIRM|nr:LysR substrate-binding domain-containing protein [Romboutsia weinsteinii]RDY26130.1 LysR family transcriptional regulator [Romboutsia weinsteinii]